MKTFTHVSHGSVKLGLDRKPHLFKLLPFSNYAKALSIPVPPKIAWERDIAWQMLGNDTAGDCVIAWVLHQIMGWQAVANAGTPVTFTSEQAIQIYSAITGYVPGDENTDNGTDPNQALEYWQQNGLLGHSIAGGVSLDISNLDAIRAALYLFGGVGLSINAPNYIMNVPAGGSWSEQPGDDTTIAGGHEILGIGFGLQGFRIVSWGTTYTFDVAFFQKYVVAAQAAVSTDWIKQAGVSPSGVDLNGLLADLKEAA